MVTQNDGLVWSIVRRFKNRGYDLEDLHQIGVIGLIKAIKRFDDSYNTKLSSYAVPYIIGEIKIFLRDDGMIKVSRNLQELKTKINVLEKEYENKGKSITIEEIRKKLGESNENIILAQNIDTNVDSINSSFSKDDDSEKEEKMLAPSNDNQENKILEKIMLKDAIKNLDDKEREIIIRRYFKEETQEMVARKFGISQVQISRIEKKILQKMRMKIGEYDAGWKGYFYTY